MTSNEFCFVKFICFRKDLPQKCSGKSSVTNAPKSITADGVNLTFWSTEEFAVEQETTNTQKKILTGN